MELPDKKLKRVVYEYEDGNKYEITERSVINYQKNIKAASLLHFIHYGNVFRPIKWTKSK